MHTYTLLITGATGFIGGAVLANIINNSSNIKLLLLVRADNPEYGLRRIQDNMCRFNIKYTPDTLTAENILLGDMGNPNSFIYDPRIECVTHVINCSAVSSFSNNPFIWKVNVEGTLVFAKRMEKVKGLLRFLHVGTAMSCSPAPGSLVQECIEPNENTKYLIEYTRSKSAIERLMLQKCPNLPLLIARPSIVVGHTRYGCQPSGSIFWLFRMGVMLQKFMCSMDDRIDIIPVDYCADALLFLLESSLPYGEIVHISAGEDNSITFLDIAKAMGLKQDNYEQVNYETLVEMSHEFKDILGPCNERLILKAIRLYGLFAKLNVCFSNSKLLSIGMTPPPRFTDYIDICVQTSMELTISQQMAEDFK